MENNNFAIHLEDERLSTFSVDASIRVSCNTSLLPSTSDASFVLSGEEVIFATDAALAAIISEDEHVDGLSTILTWSGSFCLVTSVTFWPPLLIGLGNGRLFSRSLIRTLLPTECELFDDVDGVWTWIEVFVWLNPSADGDWALGEGGLLLLSFCCPFCGINIYYDQSRENVSAYDWLD